MSKEIIDLLNKAIGTMPHIEHKQDDNDAYCLVSKALTLFKQQPTEPTSLGNTIRRIADNSKCNETDKDIIHQAADRLDAWWKYIGELKEQIKQQPKAGDHKDLIKALKRYGHHDSPCAGILDLNDDSECSCGFEAAIAKAKKGIKRDGTTPSP